MPNSVSFYMQKSENDLGEVLCFFKKKAVEYKFTDHFYFCITWEWFRGKLLKFIIFLESWEKNWLSFLFNFLSKTNGGYTPDELRFSGFAFWKGRFAKRLQIIVSSIVLFAKSHTLVSVKWMTIYLSPVASMETPRSSSLTLSDPNYIPWSQEYDQFMYTVNTAINDNHSKKIVYVNVLIVISVVHIVF